MNLTDFIQHDGSELILVRGIGKIQLSRAKRHVADMLEDLSARVDNLARSPDNDPLMWKGVQDLLARGTLQAYIDAIVQATKE